MIHPTFYSLDNVQQSKQKQLQEEFGSSKNNGKLSSPISDLLNNIIDVLAGKNCRLEHTICLNKYLSETEVKPINPYIVMTALEPGKIIVYTSIFSGHKNMVKPSEEVLKHLLNNRFFGSTLALAALFGVIIESSLKREHYKSGEESKIFEQPLLSVKHDEEGIKTIVLKLYSHKDENGENEDTAFVVILDRDELSKYSHDPQLTRDIMIYAWDYIKNFLETRSQRESIVAGVKGGVIFNAQPHLTAPTKFMMGRHLKVHYVKRCDYANVLQYVDPLKVDGMAVIEFTKQLYDSIKCVLSKNSSTSYTNPIDLFSKSRDAYVMPGLDNNIQNTQKKNVFTRAFSYVYSVFCSFLKKIINFVFAMWNKIWMVFKDRN